MVGLFVILGWDASCRTRPKFLDKGVRTGPIATQLGLACAQTAPRLPNFDHMPMADRVATGKLWQADIIKITQEIVDKMSKRGPQEAPVGQK